MQAIITKYHGPTNTRGSRVSATAANGQRVFMGYDSAHTSEENHRIAAEKLCEKLDWHGKLASGSLKNGMVWVFVS